MKLNYSFLLPLVHPERLVAIVAYVLSFTGWWWLLGAYSPLVAMMLSCGQCIYLYQRMARAHAKLSAKLGLKPAKPSPARL